MDENGNKVDLLEDFGKLKVNGYLALNTNGKDITIAHSVMTTELIAEVWCSETLFSIEPLAESPKYFCKHLRLEGDLSISEGFKLFRL